MTTENARQSVFPKATVVLAATLLCGERAGAATVTGAVSANAEVSANCSLDVLSHILMPSYDPAALTPTDGAGRISLSCSAGAPAYVTLDEGSQPAPGSTQAMPLRRMSAGDIDRLRYDLYRDAERTVPWGNTLAAALLVSGAGGAQEVHIFARVPSGQQVRSGVYRDDVLVTVTY